MVYSPDMSGGSQHESYDMYEPTDEGDIYHDHPAVNVPHQLAPAVPQGTKMAGDILTVSPDLMGGSHTTRDGIDSAAADYATGMSVVTGVRSIGREKINDWVSNTKKRLGK